MDYCPICYSDASIENASYAGHKQVKCPICGEYYFAKNLFEDPKLAVCAYMYNALKNNKVISVFTNSSELSKPNANMDLVKAEHLLDLYPKNLSELIDQSVLNIAFFIKKIGVKINNIYLTNVIDRQYARKSALMKTLFCVYDNNVEQVSILLKHLEKLGYIEPLSVGVFTLTLSFKGWLRVEKLQNNASTINQALLIASPREEMVECRNILKQVVSDLNLIPKFSDESKYSKPVTSETFYEIRRSKIVIADLTYYKPHFYYETGYAEALKRPVIYTCKQGYSIKRQLDIIHNSLIKWESPEQLRNALTIRVAAQLNIYK
jgi:nucleoside 2-deoxyribosyltransferase